MSTLEAESQIFYPESDGKPMADNTVQFRWITTIQGNLDLLFHDRPDVFVAGDNLWYPVEGQPGVCMAPDVYVAFGRPKGDRGSYKQWEEGGMPLSVVFEVLSPNNTTREMRDKLAFYQRHGVREYYVIDPCDPDRVTLEVFEREGDVLKPLASMPEWISPLTAVRFAVTPAAVELFYPDGRPFLSFVELGELQMRTEQALEAARQRVDAERQKADAERQRAAKLAAKLRELGVDPDAV